MNITITSNTLDAGGAERQRVELANGLSQAGFTVRLAALQSWGPLRSTVAPSVEVTLGWRAADHLGKHEAVITGTTNTECAWALRALRCRPSRRGQWLMAIHNPTGPSAPAPAPFVRFASRRLAGRVIGLSPSHTEWARAMWGMPATSHIGNGTEVTKYAEVAQFRAGQPDYVHDYAFLGRLSLEHKGLDLLLEALQTVPGRLAIAGEGPDADRLAHLAAELQVADRIDWLGYADPSAVFRSSRVLVLPSRYEGQPMVLLEAAAAGIPVIATRVGGAEAFVPESQLVAPEDPVALAQAMSRSHEFFPGEYVRDSSEMVNDYSELLRAMIVGRS